MDNIGCLEPFLPLWGRFWCRVSVQLNCNPDLTPRRTKFNKIFIQLEKPGIAHPYPLTKYDLRLLFSVTNSDHEQTMKWRETSKDKYFALFFWYNTRTFGLMMQKNQALRSLDYLIFARVLERVHFKMYQYLNVRMSKHVIWHIAYSVHWRCVSLKNWTTLKDRDSYLLG